MTLDENGFLKVIQNLKKDGAVSASAIRRFLSTVDAGGSLQPFLERILPLTIEILGGVCGQIWLKAFDSSGPCFAIRYRMDSLADRFLNDEKHDRLVKVAWQQRQPMLVEPRHRSNHSDSNQQSTLILFSPIVHLNQPLALIEVILPELSKAMDDDFRKAHLRAALMISNAIHIGLQKRLAMTPATLLQAQSQLEQLESEIQSHRQAILRSIETRLRQFQGWTFASFEENQAFAKMIHEVLEAHGLRVRCPECDSPAILRCLKSGNSKHGIFVYDHYLDDGRTFHGGPSAFPLLTIVAKPARRPPNSKTSRPNRIVNQ